MTRESDLIRAARDEKTAARRWKILRRGREVWGAVHQQRLMEQQLPSVSSRQSHLLITREGGWVGAATSPCSCKLGGRDTLRRAALAQEGPLFIIARRVASGKEYNGTVKGPVMNIWLAFYIGKTQGKLDILPMGERLRL